MKVAVIGAGPAGLSAAYNLARRGLEVDLFEASDAVGGLARTLELWGHKVDLGPHRFYSSDPRVNQLWLDVVGRDYRMVQRRTRILSRGRTFDYPLRLPNVLRNLGLIESARCLLSYLAQLWQPEPDSDSFEGWVSRHFGRRLYTIFFETYSEKLWGIPGSQLDADFAAQRIQKLSFARAVRAALSGGQHSAPRTLVNEFAYPLEGTGMVYQRMAQRTQEMGGKLHLNCPVKGVLVDQGRVSGLRLEGQTVEGYDRVVSSMPLTLLVEGLEAPEPVRRASQHLRFRNTILVYRKVGSRELFPDNRLYVHSPQLKLGRITNFRNWVPELCGDETSSVLSLEYWCNRGDSIWEASEEEMRRLAEGEFRGTGLLGQAQIEECRVIRIPRCYPVYTRGYRTEIDAIRRYLSEIEGLDVIGRYGSFKYNNQDHSLLMGLMVAQNITGEGNHSLWDVNSDTEYLERSRISETGLVSRSAAS